MDKLKQLREQILALTKEYGELLSQENKGFIPGESRIPYAGRVFDSEEVTALVDSSLDFWLTHGRYSRQFETELANKLNVRNAYFVNSGSSANLLAFLTLTSPLLIERAIRRGDEVITVAAGFPTTIAPIIQYGAIPVFVDVERETANINPSYLEQALSSKTKAIFLAHTLGTPFDIEKISNFCKKHNLWLIEDNCDALGSTYHGKMTGTFGDIGTSSFYPPHHLTTGEGGAVYTNDPLLAKITLSIRDWGRDCMCPSGVDNLCGHRFTKQFGSLPVGYDHKYVYSHFGCNLKATDMQAAIGCVQLKKLDSFTRKRRENFQYLLDGLQGIPYLSYFKHIPGAEPSWFGFLINVSENAPFTRNDLTKYLESKKIQTRNLFAGNILKHPCFEGMKEGVDFRIASALTETDFIMNNTCWIGVYPGMSKEKLDYMIKNIRDFVSGALNS